MAQSGVGQRSRARSSLPSFTVTATAHLGAHPRSVLDGVLDTLPGARFHEASGDLIYRDAVEAIDPGEAIKLMQDRILAALSKAHLFAVRSEVEAWVTDLEH
jgi:hypothetical protein